MSSNVSWTNVQDTNNRAEQTLARRALLFDRIMDLPEQYSSLRNALLALWYPCFDGEAIDLALRQMTGSEG